MNDLRDLHCVIASAFKLSKNHEHQEVSYDLAEFVFQEKKVMAERNSAEKSQNVLNKKQKRKDQSQNCPVEVLKPSDLPKNSKRFSSP